MHTESLTVKAKDLTHEYPRSPRDTLAGYVLAARVLDKCRAAIAGTLGEYHFDCPLDRFFFDFASVDSNAFRSFVARGADGDKGAAWITEHAVARSRVETIKWNNRIREMRLSDMPEPIQEFLEDYIPQYLPK